MTLKRPTLRGPIPKRLGALLLAAVLLATTAACGSGDEENAKTETTTLTVFAAASLTKTFTEIGKRFEAENEGVKVAFSFGGSSDLVAQIQQGAPADVFASADTNNMDKAADDVEGTPVNFATNVLQIATPPDNPAGVSSLQDLAKPDVQVVVCAPEVPCGAATVKVEEAAGIDIKPVSEESSVTDVLGKVTTGDADAGLVYVTDVKGAGDAVKGIAFDESSAAVNVYPIAALAASKHAELAAQFLDFVTGSQGQEVLSAAGFGKP